VNVLFEGLQLGWGLVLLPVELALATLDMPLGRLNCSLPIHVYRFSFCWSLLVASQGIHARDCSHAGVGYRVGRGDL